MNFHILDEPYIKNFYERTESVKLSVRMIPGKIPILIDAPHAVRQCREGKTKMADLYTDFMVEWLCEQTGAHGCICNQNGFCDPNYDPEGVGLEYRDHLGKYCKDHEIKLLIDLHGTKDSDIVCEIGTNKYKNLCGHQEYAKVLKIYLSDLGRVEIDNNFRASKIENISRHIAHYYGIPSIQLEVGSSYRKNRENRMKFLRCMSEFIPILAQY